MNPPLIDLDAYCKRIGYSGERTATLATLQQLLELHTREIAFENLTSLLGEHVLIDLPTIENKLLHQGRGGYCFEHNTLLWNVLQQLGFAVTGLASRVRWNVPEQVATPIGHMVLKIQIDAQAYLVDAGFGGVTLTSPLRLDTEAPQATTHEAFRLTRNGEVHTLSVQLGKDWKSLYSFDLREFQPVDYEVWNWFTCTAPPSPFINNLMAARPTVDGRHALNNNRYTYRRLSGAVETHNLTSIAELRAALTDKFNIRLPHSAALDARLADIAVRTET